MTTETPTLNLENLNTLIDWVPTRDWKSDRWLNQDQCLVGMVQAGTGENRVDLETGYQYLSRTLGVSIALAENIFILCSHRALGNKEDGTNPGVRHRWDHFQALSLQEQNQIIGDMLRSIRDSGGAEAKWNLPVAA